LAWQQLLCNLSIVVVVVEMAKENAFTVMATVLKVVNCFCNRTRNELNHPNPISS